MDAVGSVADNYEKWLVARADLSRTPIGGTFELLPVCNMRCKMCYIRQSMQEVQEKGGLRDVAFWERIIREAVEEGLLYILFTGGEPFLYPDFRALYEKVSEMPVYIVINTNATLLDEETVMWLASKNPRRINISLYGGSNETYEKLCGLKDGFDRVINAFSLLKRYHIDFRVHGVLVPDNLNDYMDIVRICSSYGVSLRITSYMFPPYRREKHIDYNKHRLKGKDAARITYQYMKDSYSDEERFDEHRQKKLEEILNPQNTALYGNTCMSCRGGVSSFWVDWRGRVSACGVMDQSAVDLRTHSFSEAWESVRFFRDNARISVKCSTCENRNICPVCAAAAYCETGRTDGTPEYCCEFCDEYANLLRNGE